jgi:hypothetical protein
MSQKKTDPGPPQPRRDPGFSDPPRVSAIAILHQEGVIAVIALVGLMWKDGSAVAGLAPRGALGAVVLGGGAVGLAGFVGLWLVRAVLPPLRDLESWQREMVRTWTATDVAAVALFSGFAEEALVRALLQPLVGIVPAAAVFAVLHVVPDRRVWMWPVIAFGLGLVLGGLYSWGGYPAAASAHTVLNGLALTRLRADDSGRGKRSLS